MSIPPQQASKMPVKNERSDLIGCYGQFHLSSSTQMPMAYPITAQPQVVQVFTNSSPLASQWTSDVMDCFKDTKICLCGTFCTPILACRTASDFGECFCLPMVGGTVLALRTGIRERHHIPGTICDDCVCLTFCGPCTLCQMARELKARK